MRSLISRRWRQDRLPLLLYIITFVVMTYPFVFHMGDSLPIHNSDTHEILAKNWQLRDALIHGKNLDHSELLFHPNGLDITLQPQRWTAFPLWTALYTLFGDPLAYNLVSLFGILFKAYGMYLFGLFLFRAPIPAWVCGAFYAFAAPMLAMALRNPDTGATEWIPWFMLCLAYGIKRLEVRGEHAFIAMFLAGLCFSLNLYMHQRIGIFAMLLGGGYIVWSAIACRLWARRRFWLALAVFALTASAASAPLLLRTLHSDVYDYAIDRPVRTNAGGAIDLLTVVKADHDWPVNIRQSIASLSGAQLEVRCLCEGMAHVGIVAIVFASMGAVFILRFRRREAGWIIMTVLAFALSLGVVFFVNGQPLDIYWTPYRLLQDNFFFRALWHPFRMVFVFLFPFSILVGYGLHSRLRTIRLDRRESVLLVISVIALLYGTSIFPVTMSASPRPAYLSVLTGLPDGAVIDLPFGRHPSKYYMSMQRFHGRPIVEGMLPRTPPAAYDYINGNVALSKLRGDHKSVAVKDWRDAVSSLRQDGFRYVVVHRNVPLALDRRISIPAWISYTFDALRPVYEDSYARVFDIADADIPLLELERDGFSFLPRRDSINVRVGDHFMLHSWSLLGPHDVAPCQTVTVESWWELTAADAQNTTLELILSEEDGDGQVAISKKSPSLHETSDWQKGLFYRDDMTLEIPCSVAGGKYLLLLGLLDSNTWASQRFRYLDGSDIGDLYYLTTISVNAS